MPIQTLHRERDQQRKQWSDHKVAHSLRFRSPRCPRAVSRESLRSRFEFSCCGASVLLCPFVFVPPSVAVSSTSLATTAQLGPQEWRGKKRVCWRKRCGADLPGARVSLNSLGGGCRRIPVRGMLVGLGRHATHRRRADIGNAKKPRTPNCARATAARVWWSSREKSVQVVFRDQYVLVVLGLRQGVVIAATDAWQCPSRLVQDGHASWFALRRRFSRRRETRRPVFGVARTHWFRIGDKSVKGGHQLAPDPGSVPMLHARWLTRRCPDSKKRWRRWEISKDQSWTF